MKTIIDRKWIGGVCNRKMALVISISIATATCKLHAQTQKECDIPLNVVVSSSGNLCNDGKGIYSTGKDWVAPYLNPSRWPEQSFVICMNWPFERFPGCDSSAPIIPTGTRDSRTLLHQMTKPVIDGKGKSLGVFTGPGGGNDIAISRPLTPTINTFLDMVVGSSLSPQSVEVRFCNSDCSEYYSVIFGAHSLFGNQNIHGEGSTRPIITRSSELTWTISFPPGTIGRLWNRTPEVPTTELYYYEGSLEIKKQ